MAFWDRFFTKQRDERKSIFSFLIGRSAPDMKGSDYLKAYKGWVYSCVNAIAEEIGAMVLSLYRKKETGVEQVSQHLALVTLTAVNSFMTKSELLLITQSFLELMGEAFWYLPKGRVTGKPVEIWPLDPTRMTVVKSASNFVGGYVFRSLTAKEVPLELDEIIHFKRFNPLNAWRGMGTVQAAALAIDVDTYSGEWNRNFFYNAALPSGTLETEGTLTEDQYKRIKAQWEDRHRGVDNAHRIAILEGGVKFSRISLTQKDMDFLEQRRFSRDEILGIFRVPKTVLGISEDVNRANAEATDYVFAKRVIKPRMRFIVDRLNEFYLPLFGVENGELEFRFEDPVPENKDDAREERKVGISSGYLTINEAREEIGKKPVKGGDFVYLPVNLMPIGSVEGKKTLPAGGLLTKQKDSAVEKRIRFIRNEILKRKKIFHQLLLEQKGFVLERLKNKKSKKSKLDNLIRIVFAGWDDWIGLLREPSDETLREAFVVAGKEAIRQVGIDIAFDLANPRAVAWLEENALRHAKQISKTMKSEITKILRDGIEEGLSIDDMASQIAKFYDKQSEWRALRIARTEVIDAYAHGSLEGYKQSGIVKAKKWLTAGDDRVDPNCQMNERDGEIPLDASFSSGADAPPDHPNCRCTLQGVA